MWQRQGRRVALTGHAGVTFEECFGASLWVAFGQTGMRMTELDKKDAEGLVAERQELSNALKELKWPS
jgi:hypothetical protein